MPDYRQSLWARLTFGVLAGAVAGAAIGTVATNFVYCEIEFPGSNTCGLMGIFYGLPVGLVVGAVAGGVVAYWRHKDR
jgi:hypothetical protein